MMIRKAKHEEAIECLECVKNSLLWNAYFEDESPLKLIDEDIQQNRITVAVNDEDRCIGFMSIAAAGCFHKFSYLSILSVHKEFRNRGVGKELLNHFENEGFEKEDKVFLLCSDFNVKARMFYKNNGYVECGQIPDLFKKGITEHLFVKYKEVVV